jgi:hypothetical protein
MLIHQMWTWAFICRKNEKLLLDKLHPACVGSKGTTALTTLYDELGRAGHSDVRPERNHGSRHERRHHPSPLFSSLFVIIHHVIQHRSSFLSMGRHENSMLVVDQHGSL